MAADFTELRVAFRDVLVADAALLTLLANQPRIFYLRVRKAALVPAVTFVDAGDRPDPNVPYHTRIITFDIWANNIEQAAGIGERIRELLDKRSVPVSSGNWRINIVWLNSDRELPLEEGDLVQRTIEFQYSAYDLTQTV